MIKVTFTDDTTRNYRIGAKRLGANKWHHVEYRLSFQTIADIIKTDVEKIKAWRVI